MVAEMRKAGLLLPSLLTLVALAVLIGLGNWQWQRKLWKDGIIARLNDAAHAGAVDLNTAVPTTDQRYQAVSVTGRFQHDQEVYVFWTRSNRAGYLVLTPLKREGQRAVLVNRGFVPARLKSPEARPKGQPHGVVTVRGLLTRQTDRAGMFTPPPDSANRTWYAIRPTEIATTLGLDVAHGYTVEADARPNPGGWPRGRSIPDRIAEIPNRHLEYALTWWGLALTLIGVYIAFAVSRIQAVQRSTE